MRTITTTVYSFDELSKEAQAKAIDAYRYLNVDYDGWHDPILEDARDRLESMGYEEPEVRYSGFSSQGDGASFTAGVDLVAWMKRHKLGNKYRALFNAAKDGSASATVDQSDGHYYHQYTMTVDLRVTEYGGPAHDFEKVDEQAGKVEALLLEEARDTAASIYEDLENEYTYQTTDEAVTEGIRANDYEFTEDGGRA